MIPPEVIVLEGAGVHCDVLAAAHAQSFDETWGAGVFAELLLQPNAFVLIAQQAEFVAGFALCRVAAEECEVLSCAVAPPLRRRGVGRCLMLAAAAEAARRGSRRILLEVAHDNAAARGLYAGCGLHVVGRRRRYYRRPAAEAADALIMAADL